MKTWQQILINSLWIGNIAGATTAVTAAACGYAENGNASEPLNAISHILYGEEASSLAVGSVKYTGTGLALNNAAQVSWALLYEALFGKAAAQGEVPQALAGGVVVAGIAYVTDYHLVPKRFTPGFEKCLSPRSLFIIYGVLALSLGLSGLWRGREGGQGLGSAPNVPTLNPNP